MSGPFFTQYEVYYKRLDPQAENKIGAMEAATFLKKSGLPDAVLGKVGMFIEKNQIILLINVSCCSRSGITRTLTAKARWTRGASSLLANSWHSFR